jgi:cholest-4-en-3-one 26-monooxygenase
MRIVGEVERLRSNFIGGIKHIPVAFTPGERLHPVELSMS